MCAVERKSWPAYGNAPLPLAPSAGAYGVDLPYSARNPEQDTA